MPGSNSQILPCPPGERGAALGVLYRRVPGVVRVQLIANALLDSEQGLIDLSGLWIARRRDRIVGTLLTQPLAGHAAAVWAPEVAPSWRRAATAVGLVRAALDDLRARRFKIAQALLDESSPRHGAADLASGGMPRVTELLYLERSTTRPLAIATDVPPLHWTSFGDAAESEFRAALQATYIDSLDMPELEGIRSLDDILASHCAAGRFAAERWRLGRVRSEPDTAAVLLLSEALDRDAWEVAYLGLTPAARAGGWAALRWRTLWS